MDNGEQNEPMMDTHVASDADKIAGIIEQTRSDVGTETHERIIEVLKQRFTDAGLVVSEEDTAEHARRVAAG